MHTKSTILSMLLTATILAGTNLGQTLEDWDKRDRYGNYYNVNDFQDPNTSSTDPNIYIQKWDKHKKLLWDASFTVSGKYPLYFRDIRFDSSQNLYLLAEMCLEPDDLVSCVASLIKVSPKGQSLWTKTFQVPRGERFSPWHLVIDSADSPYILGEYSFPRESANNSESDDNFDNSVALTVKYSGDGNILWRRQCPKKEEVGVWVYNTRLFGAVNCLDGGICVGADLAVSREKGWFRFLAVSKYAQDGRLLWQGRYTVPGIQHIFGIKLDVDTYGNI